MINHMRTLLLNRPAAWFSSVNYADYVPGEFHSLTLDTQLQKVKNAILPIGLDAAAENYLGTLLTKILHAPELETYSLQPDSRYTYQTSLETLGSVVDIPLTVNIYKSSACDMTIRYRIDGTAYPDNISLAGNHVWILRKNTTHLLDVQYSRGSTQTINVIDPNLVDITRDITLLPDYIRVYFEIPSGVLTGAFTYRLETDIAVPYNIAERSEELNRFLAQAGTSERIFRPVGIYASTISELRNVWLSTTEVTLSFGAAMLGYLYQLDALWRKQNGQ